MSWSDSTPKAKAVFFPVLLNCPVRLKKKNILRKRACSGWNLPDLADLADIQAGNLPFGKGRLLEISRALAVEPQLILMDEPAAGLNSRETAELALLIRRIRESGITIVLVEHDMDLVMDICDSIVVLNLGKKLAEGTPREIQENPQVISAYLGDG